MKSAKCLEFYLEPALRQSAEAGQHNFLSQVARVAQGAGFDVRYLCHGDVGKTPGAYSLTHMKPPPDGRGLVFRRSYHYPFWQIDNSPERWRWDVARAPFLPDQIDGREARRFYRFWRKRLFGDAPERSSSDGYVYVPLQGRLLEARSFQSCSPLEMLETCLLHAGARRVIATLHPKETYGDKELAALAELEARAPNLSVRAADMVETLRGCDYVVTQNSSAAFNGYFFGKPAILFAKVDFHHIALQADADDPGEAFCSAPGHAPDHARYLWWFWQDQSINAGRPDAEARIAARLARFGWPME